MMQQIQLDQLKNEIDTFCNLYLPADCVIIKNRKIIHDTIWKTNYFTPFEVSIINTPLFQRLRNINQMGFVDYVYASAKHSRFEHSLGVAILASKMVDAVRAHDSASENLISDIDKESIRLSALLHDIGHCLFSHTSELVYGHALESAIKKEFNNELSPSPHEFLSYLIVTSKSFSAFFNNLRKCYDIQNLDLIEIANRIVGLVLNEEDRFKTNFINGPFDADKLDYFHRDSQFSGIPIQLDIDRLFYEIAISDVSVMDCEINSPINDLTIGISGVGCIEQIIFNKMLLYSTIYNHHKVQAIDCMFKGVFEYIINNNIQIKINGIKKTISSPVDFLYLADYDLFGIMNETDDNTLIELIKNIRDRKLLKRALVLNRRSIKNNFNKDKSNQNDGAAVGGLLALLSTKVNRSNQDLFLRELAKKILDGSSAKCLLEEIWIDIPKFPSFKEASAINIRTSKDVNNQEYKQIDMFYPYNQYKELYVTHKLNAHVYAPDNVIEEITKSAKRILKEEIGLELDENMSILPHNYTF